MKNELTNYTDGFFDPLFDFFTPDVVRDSHVARGLEMRTDVTESGSSYELDVDLPGINKDDITVTLDDGYLTIKAKANRNINQNEKGKNFVHRERFSGVSSRSYYLGSVEEEQVEASFKDGVLHIVVPKKVEKPVENGHRIEIK